MILQKTMQMKEVKKMKRMKKMKEMKKTMGGSWFGQTFQESVLLSVQLELEQNRHLSCRLRRNLPTLFVEVFDIQLSMVREMATQKKRKISSRGERRKEGRDGWRDG